MQQAIVDEVAQHFGVDDDRAEEIIRSSVWRASHGIAGADVRWAVRRETGLSDRALRDAFANEVGIEGGFIGSGTPPAIWFKGGKTPSLRVCYRIGDQGVTISGQKLVNLCREILEIPRATSRETADAA